jgi:hypothetical protein
MTMKDKLWGAAAGAVASLIVAWAVTGSAWFTDQIRRSVSIATAQVVLERLDLDIQNASVKDGEPFGCKDGYTLIAPLCEFDPKPNASSSGSVMEVQFVEKDGKRMATCKAGWVFGPGGSATKRALCARPKP